MLNIQVLGNGLIPRGLGLAPRLEPFPADYILICTIMQTRGLEVKMVNPDDGKLIKLTPHNVKRMWDKYGKRTPAKSRVIEVNMPPQKEEEKKEPQIYAPMNQKPDQVKEVPKDVIHDAVKNAASTVFDKAPESAAHVVPEQKVETTVSDEKSEEKPAETGTEDTAAPEKKEEEKKEPQNDNKNNNGKNQGFKPINNPKQK